MRKTGELMEAQEAWDRTDGRLTVCACVLVAACSCCKWMTSCLQTMINTTTTWTRRQLAVAAPNPYETPASLLQTGCSRMVTRQDQ